MIGICNELAVPFSLSRSQVLFLGVATVMVLIGLVLFGWVRNRTLQHPASMEALEMVRSTPQLQKTIGQPHTYGAWVKGEGILTGEDIVTVEVPVKGPEGEVLIAIEAHREGSVWIYDLLQIRSPGGELIYDLVELIEVQQRQELRGALLARLGEGRELMGKGAYSEAILVFAEVYEESPESAEALRLWGISAYRIEDYEDAETQLLAALSLMVSLETDDGYEADTGSYSDWGLQLESWAIPGEVDYDPLKSWIEAAETLGLVYLEQEKGLACIDVFETILESTQELREDFVAAQESEQMATGTGDASTGVSLPPEAITAWYHRARCSRLKGMWETARRQARMACHLSNRTLDEACEMAQQELPRE